MTIQNKRKHRTRTTMMSRPIMILDITPPFFGSPVKGSILMKWLNIYIKTAYKNQSKNEICEKIFS
jgi:hypothetical protein